MSVTTAVVELSSGIVVICEPSIGISILFVLKHTLASIYIKGGLVIATVVLKEVYIYIYT